MFIFLLSFINSCLKSFNLYQLNNNRQPTHHFKLRHKLQRSQVNFAIDALTINLVQQFISECRANAMSAASCQPLNSNGRRESPVLWCKTSN